MLKIYTIKEDRLVEIDEASVGQPLELKEVVWFDLLTPSVEEELVVEKHCGIDVPTVEEMQEIESSSRLYKEDGALFMTINSLSKNGQEKLRSVGVTFIVKSNILVSVRYDEIQSISSFTRASAIKASLTSHSPITFIVGILETIVDKAADTLEKIHATIDSISQEIFSSKPDAISKDLEHILITLGLQEETNSKTRESLVSISRMTGYLNFNMHKGEEHLFESRIRTLLVDAADLKDQSTFLGNKINFLLDACLGLINIEQNTIIKIFSVAAVVFLPPTLIASIYGMNFHTFPELNWAFGYPLSIGLMLLSSLLCYWYFKRKGWL